MDGALPDRVSRLPVVQTLRIGFSGHIQQGVVTCCVPLKESHGDEKRYHDEMIAKLQKEYQKLQDRIDAMYVDKLDGKVPLEFFDRKNSDWRGEQAEILRNIEKHQNANCSYLEEGVRLLELGQKAASLYEKQEMKEKRRILDFLFSNCLWKDGALIPKYRKPFDMLAVTNSAYQKRKATSRVKSGLSEIWLPFVNEYRTLCTTPLPEVKVIFRQLIEVGLPC